MTVLQVQSLPALAHQRRQISFLRFFCMWYWHGSCRLELGFVLFLEHGIDASRTGHMSYSYEGDSSQAALHQPQSHM